MSFTGGKLKLKGSDLLKAGGGVKKKKKKTQGKGDEEGKQTDELALTSLEGTPLPPRDEAEDRRTEAEKKRDARIAQMEAQQIKKLATKSHRERIKEYNEHLASLSEHYDIPKVGPG